MDHEAPIVHDFLGISWLDFNKATIMMIVISSVIVFVIMFLASRNLKMKPTGMQNAIEALIDFVKGIIGDSMDWRTGKMFLPLGLTLISYIFISNILGVITVGVYDHNLWWKSPTSDAGITLSLAAFVIVLSNFYGIKLKGFKRYGKEGFMEPIPFILPFKIIEEFTNTMTLGFRLFGNIFAGEILLSLIMKMAFIAIPYTFIAVLPMMAWQGFSLFIGAIQAFIFTMLTMVYMSHKVADDH